MMESKKRVVYFDVLRLIATFAVVVLHLSAQNWYGPEVTSRAWFAFNMYNSAVRWAVPVFVMISGALFLGRDIPISTLLKKNVLRIAAAFAFWSALYAIRGYFVYDTGLRQAVIAFFEGHYHMWFLYMIVGMYLLVPLLRRIVTDDTLTWYFMLLSLVFAFLWPLLTWGLGFIDKDIRAIMNSISASADFSFPLGYTIYFIGGYCLSQKVIGKTLERAIYLLGILGLIFTVAASQMLSILINAPSTRFYSNHSVNVLCMAAAVFVFGKQHLDFASMSDRAFRILRALSKYSFGAFLVHAMVIEVLNDRLGLNTLSMNAFFSVPLIAVLVFVIAMAISALLHQIPFVKKYFV